mgnify:CR=1 FL=1
MMKNELPDEIAEVFGTLLKSAKHLTEEQIAGEAIMKLVKNYGNPKKP